MSNPLSPCPNCTRHVRASETCCPFCRAELTAANAHRAAPATRLKRAAIFVFGATLTAAGCGSTTSPEDAQGNDTATQQDVPEDDGQLAVRYGAPPIDAGSE